MSVVNTEWTITDATGKPLCHSLGQAKAALNSERKRAVRQAFWTMCEAAGMYDPQSGNVECAVSGATLSRHTDSTDMLAVDLCHDVADERFGALCPCNLFPGMRAVNLAQGTKRVALKNDPRRVWRAVWEASARPSKVARAI